MTEQHLNFIGGKWCEPQTGKFYRITNPAHPSDVLGSFASSGQADADAAIQAASNAANAWAGMPGPQRGALLFRFAQLLDESKTELGKIITLEQGKALGEGIGEVGRAATEARFMAGEASRGWGQSFASERAGYTAYTVQEPLGVVAAICPWNFPVVTPVRKIAPALAYGNTVVFKPASLTPWSAVYVTQLLQKAGIPDGVVNLVMGAGSAVGNSIVGDARIRGISFTGSTTIGLALYETAARHLASVQLELGGKNPAIVFDYDDLQGAAQEIVSAAFACSGQRCTALSRVIVKDSQAAELVEKILVCASKVQVGDGMLPGTTMGPLVSKAQFDIVEGYVKQGVGSGAKLLLGGKALVGHPEEEGFYYGPTVFDGVSPDSALAKEEIFGPVLPVIHVPDIDAAVAVANDTRYGLAASVFTSRMDVMSKCVRQINAGMIHVNHGTASQAHVPFGGHKDSGQGAFSIGPTAKDFFTTVKTIYGRW
jgi:acyl-CoA reductase-like NAD-dependent aldehyde dehydrogenase